MRLCACVCACVCVCVCVCKQVCGSDFNVNTQIAPCVRRSYATWNLNLRGKIKLAEKYIGMKALSQTVLDFLSKSSVFTLRLQRIVVLLAR